MHPISETYCPDGEKHNIFDFMYGDGCLKCGYWNWNERHYREKEENLRMVNEWAAGLSAKS